jgi:hypothetical protein
MGTDILLDNFTLGALYGPQILCMEQPAEIPLAPPALPRDPETQGAPEPTAVLGIKWRPKASSKLLFVAHAAELKDPVLGELLKKIVASIGIPFDAAGFGIIQGAVQPGEFDLMPNPYGVVFDLDLWPGASNPCMVAGHELFFAPRLSALAEDKNAKKALWAFLQAVQPKIA